MDRGTQRQFSENIYITRAKDKPRWCVSFAFRVRSVCVPLINMYKGRVYDVTHCFILEKKVPSSVLI